MISKRLLSLVLVLLMIVGMTTGLSVSVLAEADPIIATLKDDSNYEVGFSGANDSATIGYNGTVEKDYDMKVVLNYPSEATGRSATITLAQGLKFSNDGTADSQVSDMMDGSVTNAHNAAPFEVSADMSNTGSKTYQFKSGVETVTINLKVRADSRFWYGTIENAVTITSKHNGSEQAEAVLETLIVNGTARTLHTGSGNYNGYTVTDSDMDIGPNYKTFFTSLTSAWDLCPVFYKNFVATVTIDSRVIVVNTDPQNWAMSDIVGDGTTTYTFTYKNSAPGLLETSLSVPVAFNFPSAEFTAGDMITGTRRATATLAGGNDGTGEASVT